MNKLEKRFEDIIHDKSGNTNFDTYESFENCAKYTAKEAKEITIEFAEYVAERYTLSKHKEWCSLGMPTINNTEDLFNKFIEEKYEK